MEENSLPPAQPMPGSDASESLDSADASAPVSSYSLAQKTYPIETLEVRNEGSAVSQRGATVSTGIRGNPVSRRKAALISLFITLLVVFVTGVAIAYVVRKRTQDNSVVERNVPTQAVSIDNPLPETNLLELQGEEDSLLVNGDIIARGDLKVVSNSFVSVLRTEALSADRTITLPNASGVVCLDVNNCDFAANDDLAQQNTQLTQHTVQITQLQEELGQIVIPPAGVTSLNNQNGAVTIQGSLNQITVGTANGVITLSTPQDLDANANVQFGSLSIDPGGEIRANSWSQTGAGNDLVINAGADNILFTDGSRTFLLPGGGGAAQTICTSQGNCGGGGATPVLLAPGSAQDDSSADVSIFINDTGGGHLIQMQSGGVDRLVVTNSGDTSVSGDLTVGGLGSGPVRATGGLLSVGAIALGSSDVSGTLAVSNGGTGAASLTANGVLLGNGAGAITSVASGGAGLCFMSNAGAPSWQACPGGSGVSSVNSLTGALTLQGTANQISVVSGGTTITLSTPQDIATNSDVQFNAMVLTGYLHSTDSVDVDVRASFGNGTTEYQSDPVTDPGKILLVTNTFHAGTDCLNGCSGVMSAVELGTATNPTMLSAYRGAVNIDTGQSLTSAAGLYVETPNIEAGGSIGTSYGVYVETLNNAGANVGLYVQSASTYGIWVDAGLTRLDGGVSLGGANPIEIEGATDNAFETTLGVVDPTADRAITFPDLDGTVCLDSGNCLGGAGGAPNNAAYLTIGNNATLSGERAIAVNATNLAFTDGGANGSYTINTVQNIATTSTPTFAGLTLNGNLNIGANTIQGTAAAIDFTNFDVSSAGAVTAVGVNAGSGLLQGTGGLTVGGTVTLSNLTNGFLEVNGAGVVSVGTINLGADTTGDYTANLGALTGLSTTGNSGEGNTPTLSVLYGSGANTAVEGDTGITVNAGTNLTGGGSITLGAGGSVTVNVADSPTFAGDVVIQGGDLTLGTATDPAVFTLHDGDGETIAFDLPDVSASYVLTLPTAVGSANQCLKAQDGTGTLFWDDCTGGAGGGLDGSGTLNRIAKFTPDGTTVGDSSLSDNGSVVTVNGNVNLAVQGTTLTVGVGSTRTGSIVLNNSTNNNTVTVQSGVTGASYALTLPTAVGSANQCLKAQDGTGTLFWDDCLGGGGGGGGITSLDGQTGPSITINNATGAGNIITIDDALADGATKGIAAFNATNFTAAGGVIDTVQGISTSAAPQFAGLTLTGNLSLGANTLQGTTAAIDFTNFDVAGNGNTTVGGTLIATGLTTLNGGLTVQTGDTFTFNGDAFTDLTGNGLQVSTGVLTLALEADKGLEVDVDGLSLIDCADGEILKYETTGNTWACASDGAGSGVTGIGTINSQTKSADGAVISGSNLVLQTADATFPGLVSTGVQTFAGAKTFNGQVIAGAGIDLGSQTLQGTTAVIDFTNFDVSSGGTVTAAGDMVIQGGDLTVGTASQTASLLLHDGDGETITFALPDVSASYALTLPAAVGAADQCLKAQDGTGTLFWDNCLGGIGGGGITSVDGQTGPSVAINNATGAANVITIDNAAADGTTKGIVAFNATNFSASSGVVNTVQGISTAATPQFAGLTLTGNLSIGTNTIQGTTAAIDLTNFDVLGNGNTTIGGTLGVSGASVTVGTASTSNGALVLQNATNALTVTLNAPNQLTGSTTISFPNTGADTADTVCLQDVNNCAGTPQNTFGTINAPNGTDPAADTASDTLNLADGDNITITGDSGTDTITVATVQNPTFTTSVTTPSLLSAGALSIASGAGGDITINGADELIVQDAAVFNAQASFMGALGVAGLTTLSGGLTIDPGDTFTFNSDAFTDLTGNGLQVTANALTLDATVSGDGLSATTSSGSGMEVLASGLTLLQGCADSDVLKWNETTDLWGCAVDNGGTNPWATDTGVVNLVTDGNTVTIGSATGGGKLFVDGDANEIQLQVQAVAGQSANILVVQDAAGTTDYLTVQGDGDVVLAAGKSLTITGGNTASRPGSPTEGMMYFDTTTNSILVYKEIAPGSGTFKWQGDRTTATKIVAANNSSQTDKDAADYVADGTGDQVEINAALTAAAGGEVHLMPGTYVAASSILVPNNTILSGAGRGTLVEMADLNGGDDELISNSDTNEGTATGVVVRDMRLDGRKDINTSGLQVGVYFQNMGDGTGSSALPGGKIIGLWISDFRSEGIFLFQSENGTLSDNVMHDNAVGMIVHRSSSNNTITGNTAQGNGSFGFYLQRDALNNTFAGNNAQGNGDDGFNVHDNSSNNTFTGNTSQGNTGDGFETRDDNPSVGNTFTGNTMQGNAQYGINIFGSNTNNASMVVTGNSIKDNAVGGINIFNSHDNLISDNKIHANGGTTTNNGIRTASADNNTITGNSITDTSCTTNCYAINISDSTSDNNYLGGNTIDTGTILDSDTGTIYGGQLNDNGDFRVGRTDLFLDSKLILGVDGRTIADNGGGTNATLTLNPASAYVEITCNDATGCNVTMDETGPPLEGTTAFIVMLTAGGTTGTNFADTANISELAGACSAKQYDSISMIYTGDRWIELSRSDNFGNGVGTCS
ncbi:MAG TPA: NosD domain-containing protein [Candidatus Limnocylindria bacterium]|nr:NosD domain-containing protein [Candidatus Limnocylindria bacterium]